ncbi:hypothetical protein Nepgr_025812 [Nepenthes gracilis]|uniref:Uncharacterized protein n=1 Tax=Nepenthes gracilis TaxID=150966 RepID=A0AAD3Y1F4_NEPGR|nr:hypothetical protein Nepgr_025812 [Nepenthes gracilis]
MSGSVRRRLKAYGSDQDDDDEDDDEYRNSSEIIRGREKEEKRKKKRKPLYKKGVRKVKRVVLFPFRKFQKLFARRNRLSSSLYHPHSNSNVPGIGSYPCCWCFSEPRTLNTAVGNSPQKNPDPHDPGTSYEDLKVLIEKNDFYSKGCNTHFDY